MVTERREREEGPLREIVDSTSASAPSPGSLEPPCSSTAPRSPPPRHARQRRARLRTQRERGDPVDRNPVPHVGPADPPRDRGPRLHRRQDHPRRRPLRVHGPAQRPSGTVPTRTGRDRVRHRRRRSLLLRLHHRPVPRRRTRTAPLAQETVLATAHVTAGAADYFGLSGDHTVIMGSRIEV